MTGLGPMTSSCRRLSRSPSPCSRRPHPPFVVWDKPSRRPAIAGAAFCRHHGGMRIPSILLVSLVGTLSFAACDGCVPRPIDGLDDGGLAQGDGGPGNPADAGIQDGGPAEDPADAGSEGPADAGGYDAGFDWADLLGDGGLPEELACLPGTLPEASLTGLIAALDLSTYSGQREDGVVCGGTTCAPGVPCCVLCGSAKCAELDDTGAYACPSLTQAFVCDGPEDCPGSADADTCCYSFSGTECRAEQECTFELPSLDGGFSFDGLLDGGLSFADGGDDDDGGSEGESDDAGFQESDDAGFEAGGDAGDDDGGPAPFDDAGLEEGGDDAGVSSLDDAGATDDAGAPTDGGALTDGGAPFDFGALFDQGLPVCTTSFPFLSECDLFAGELCCTSERFVAVDIGLCVPALVCLGGQVP